MMHRLFDYWGGHLLASVLFALVVISVALALYNGVPRVARYLFSGRRLSSWQAALLAVLIIFGGPQLAYAAYNGAVSFTALLSGANTWTGNNTFQGSTAITSATLNTAILGIANVQTENFSSFTITSGSTYAWGTNVHDVYVKKTTGSPTGITLPASPANGADVYVKDAKGDAPTNPITVTPASGTIDGASNFVMSANTYQGNHFHYNGAEWSID